MKRLQFVSGLVAVALAALPAGAQDWPVRPMRIVVPFPPGGVTDLVARAVGKSMAEMLGQPVVIDNKPGAAGRVGAEIVAKAPPDGYTMLLMTSGTHAILPAIDAKLAYNADGDFAPVLLLMSTPFALHVNPATPARTLAELVALAKAKPGTINYGSAGTGTGHHMIFELFKAAAQVDMVHVPYRGEAPAVAELISGQVQALMLSGGNQYADSGKTRVLATTDSKRWFLMPGVPSMAELGLPGAVALGWAGLMMPAGTPADIVAKANAAANKALQSDDVRKIMRDQGYTLLGGSPQELTAWVGRDVAMWRKLVADRGLKFD
jgi:tripartite-type tricarboxylate transporter receptor subunit TctC